MSYNIKNPYFEMDNEENFNDLYEIGGIRKIRELSRQLRTFFNCKTEVIRYRFRSNIISSENGVNSKFFIQKQEIESLTHEFITMLKKLKKNTQTLEEGIRSLFFDNNKTKLNKLSEITEKLSLLLHYFSEEGFNEYPKFLKFTVILAQNICLVKKCLYAQFSDFFEELEINDNNLEGELQDLIRNPLQSEIVKFKAFMKYLIAIFRIMEEKSEVSTIDLADEMGINDVSTIHSFFRRRKNTLEKYGTIKFGDSKNPTRFYMNEEGKNIVRLLFHFKSYYENFTISDENHH